MYQFFLQFAYEAFLKKETSLILRSIMHDFSLEKLILNFCCIIYGLKSLVTESMTPPSTYVHWSSPMGICARAVGK